MPAQQDCGPTRQELRGEKQEVVNGGTSLGLETNYQIERIAKLAAISGLRRHQRDQV